MIRRAGLAAFALFLFSRALSGAELPAPVQEYRTRMEKPADLAAEILRVWRETPATEKDPLAVARAEVALNEQRSAPELLVMLEAAADAARKRAEAAAGQGGEGDAGPRHDEAQAWGEYALLRFCTGDQAETVAGEKKKMAALSTVASPEEWLAVSLEMGRILTWTGDAERGANMLELASKLTAADGPLHGSEAAGAQLKAFEAWLASRDPKVNAVDRREKMEKALQGLQKTLGPQDPRTVEFVEDLLALPDNATANDARTVLYQQLIAARELTLGPEHPATIAAVARLGSYLPDAAASLPHLRRAYEAWSRGAGIENPYRIAVGSRVAIHDRQNGDYAEAEKIYEQLVAAGTKVLGGESRDVLGFRNDQAILLSSRGDYAGAEKLCRELLAIRRRVFGPEDADTLQSMNNVAVYVKNQGHFREAEKLFREALAARVKAEGEASSEALRTKSNIGSVQFALGDYPAAEAIFMEVWEARRAALGEERPDTLASLYELAEVAAEEGDLVTAEKRARQVLETRERVSGAEHPATVLAMMLLAEILSRKGEPTKALELDYRAMSIRESRYGADDPHTIDVAQELGNVLREAGDLAGAEPLLRRAAQDLEKREGREHPDTLESFLNLGKLLVKKGDFAGAEPMLRHALQRGEEVYDPEHPFVGAVAHTLAEALAGTGKTEEARTLAERASAIARKKTPGNARLRKEYDDLVVKLGGKGG